MYKKPTEENVKRAVESGWKREEAERGYSVFDYDGTGMLEIEMISDCYVDPAPTSDIITDEDCARNANKLRRKHYV